MQETLFKLNSKNMKLLIKKIVCILTSWRFIPALIIVSFHREKGTIKEDVAAWLKHRQLPFENFIFGLIYILTFHQECRNIFYYRIGWWRFLISFLARPMPTVFIHSDPQTIGSGLTITHGTSINIVAKRIGKNCTVFQNVTIGKGSGYGMPTIGDGVFVCTGAIVIGDIHIGNGSVIGAGAVVTKDVEPHSTVVGPPSYYIRINGQKVPRMPLVSLVEI